MQEVKKPTLATKRDQSPARKEKKKAAPVPKPTLETACKEVLEKFLDFQDVELPKNMDEMTEFLVPDMTVLKRILTLDFNSQMMYFKKRERTKGLAKFIIGLIQANGIEDVRRITKRTYESIYKERDNTNVKSGKRNRAALHGLSISTACIWQHDLHPTLCDCCAPSKVSKEGTNCFGRCLEETWLCDPSTRAQHGTTSHLSLLRSVEKSPRVKK